MGEFFSSLMQDNGGYFLSAYGIVFGTLIGYALWLRNRLAKLRAIRNGSSSEPD